MKINLKGLDNTAEQFGMADRLETRFARKALGLEQFGFSYQRWQPGFHQATGHVHREQEECYVVLGGSGRIKIDDDIVDLQQWDAVRVPAGVTHAMEAGPEGIELLAIGGNPPGDASMVQDWWPE
jgi:uncharacterized cupin superfamily protein